jgi:hypothetical protein
MKNRIQMTAGLLTIILSCILGLSAQDVSKTKMKGMTEEMHKSAHHKMMMAYKESVLTFAKAIRDTSEGGKVADISLTKMAFDEIKRSIAQGEEVHGTHMAGMTPEMRTKMEPMMAMMKPKMDSDKAMMKAHVDALDLAINGSSPNANAIHKHAMELVLQLEKISMPAKKKMKMAGKKPM